MSLQHWSYAAMLAFCLAGTLPLVPAFRLRVLRQPRRLLLTIVAAGSPFLVWDLYATGAGHWWFDPAQTLPPRVAGLSPGGDRLLRRHPAGDGADLRGGRGGPPPGSASPAALGGPMTYTGSPSSRSWRRSRWTARRHVPG